VVCGELGTICGRLGVTCEMVRASRCSGRAEGGVSERIAPLQARSIGDTEGVSVGNGSSSGSARRAATAADEGILPVALDSRGRVRFARAMGAGSFSGTTGGRRPRSSADTAAFEEAEGAAIEEFAEEVEGGLELVEAGERVAAGEAGREVLGALGPFGAAEGGDVEVEDALVEEEEGAEGLVLGGSRGATVGGTVVEEGGELGGAKGARVAAFVEADELAGPVEVRFFGARGVVEAAGRGAGGLDEGRGPVLGWRGRGLRSARSTVFYRREARRSCGGAVDVPGGTRVALEGRSTGAEISRICRGYDAGAARERLIARRFWGAAGDGKQLYPGNMMIRCRFLMPDLQGLRRRRSGRALDCSWIFGGSGEGEAALSRQYEDRVPLAYAGSAGVTTPPGGSAYDRDVGPTPRR
jgi:hypothetical protein